ncbi:hypothetical protein DAPPUDRAFT_118184 [Daphnia pulex]|uniref:Uncharacterized protein n=1 Tax=Daphnia pulex TaxID=6669 RepID=E9HUZ8_DAPPU|nr:hypothetical protein DAPPUDRAFT_118184 [Daphnia pulex]|eukprot:EFX64432.1 hypothetical protein DAPPUDRAFT_118184 [Daphnia pulex]
MENQNFDPRHVDPLALLLILLSSPAALRPLRRSMSIDRTSSFSSVNVRDRLNDSSCFDSAILMLSPGRYTTLAAPGCVSLSGWDGRVNWVGCFPLGQRGLAYVSKGSKQTFTPFAPSTRRIEDVVGSGQRVIQAEKELESTAKDLEESYVDRSIEAVKECSKKSEEDKFESIAKDLEESYVDKSIEAAQKSSEKSEGDELEITTNDIDQSDIKFLSPRVFKATPEDDAFDLLERNKSTGAYNQWGDTELRANLSMYLDGLARKWFLCSTLPTKWRDLRTPLRSSYIPQRGALGPPAPINIVSQLAETTADSSTQDEIKEQPILRMDFSKLIRKEVTSFAFFHCNTR